MRTLPLLAAMIFTAGSAWSGLALAQDAAGAQTPDMATLDPDNDGSVDLDEAHNAANALWLKLNPDGDETLEGDELTGRLDPADAQVNPDGDQTIEMDEWMAVVDARFKAADANGDDVVDTAEFGSEAGQSLLKLLQ